MGRKNKTIDHSHSENGIIRITSLIVGCVCVCLPQLVWESRGLLKRTRFSFSLSSFFCAVVVVQSS